MLSNSGFNQSINQNEIFLYSAMHRKRIRGAYWRTLGMFSELVKRHQLIPHAYADDTQMIRSTGFADPQILPTSARQCPSVSMRYRLGWRPIDCS